MTKTEFPLALFLSYIKRDGPVSSQLPLLLNCNTMTCHLRSHEDRHLQEAYGGRAQVDVLASFFLRETFARKSM